MPATAVEGCLTLLDRTLSDIADPALPCLDLDGLTRALGEVRDLLSTVEDRYRETALLRDDYVARISGMVKAVAAADRRRDRYAEVLSYLEDLPSMSAAQLIDQYRRVSARFRDTFPANARQMLATSPAPARK